MKLKITTILLFIPILLFAQEQGCSQKNYAYDSGEKLQYKVYYNWSLLWLNAGKAEFTIENDSIRNKEVYHVKGTGQTYPSYDWFYKVRDRYETFIDKNTFLPVHFIRDVYEGGYTIKREVNFNPDEGEAVAEDKKKNKFHITSLPDCYQDVLSAIYYARNLDFSNFAPNDTFPFNLYLDNKIYPVYIRYLGRGVLKTKYGTYRCIKIKPLLIEGTIFEGGEDMTVWISDDRNKIPVKVESPIIVGAVKIYLAGYKNLRHPLSAREDE